MRPKPSETQSKNQNEFAVNQNQFAVYLLPNNEKETLERAEVLVAAQLEGRNAVLLFPDSSDPSSGSDGTRKYKAHVIQNGYWVYKDKEDKKNKNKKEISLGNRNFGNAEMMAPNAIPNHINIINTVLAFGGIQRQVSAFEALDRHIHEHSLPEHYDKETQVAIAQTSRTLYFLSKPALARAKVKTLLTHVIRGEQAKAEAFLKKLLKTHPQSFPEIFETKMVITDYSNRKIEGTAFRLALGAEDVGIQEGEECMGEMLVRFVREHKDLMPDGEAMLARQYQEQFPDTEEAKAKEEKRIKDDSDALHRMLDKLDPDKEDSVSEEECEVVHNVDDAIQKRLRQKKSENYDPEPLKKIEQTVLFADKDKFEEAFEQLKKYLVDNRMVQDAAFRFDALKALYQFRNHLESQTKETIKTGKHFNAELLLEAFKLYDENYQRFGNSPDSAKNIVSWRKIIGYIQRFVPSCLAQAIHQGIYDIVENREKLQRLSEFKYDKQPYKLLPVDSSSSLVPGYAYAGGGGRGRVAGGWYGWPSVLVPDGRFLKTYVEQKHQRCKAYATFRRAIEESSRDEIGQRRNA